MSEQKYDWLRFWSPRDGKVAVNSYGALEDPQGPYGHIMNPEARTLEALSELHGLALLGEPGTGKSEQFEEQVTTFSETHPADLVSHFQLRDFQTDLKLCRDIFDNNPQVQTWLQGSQRLYLYLDSLDEGLLTVNTLATLLVQELKKYPADRLYVRIACRTAEWPESLSIGLRSIWGEEEFKAYELLPLREKDIEEAARAERIDRAAFFEALNRRNVGPFAIKPVTLKFLLKVFQEKKSFPQSQAELYALGCRYLCEEFNQSRRDSKRTGRLQTSQLLRVAQRIAAISVFGNRSAIWTGPASTDVPSSDITVEELTAGSEGSDSDVFQVGEDEIREALKTGLFTSRGPHRMVWAHQTYAEFLAAQYLTEHEVAFSQKVALISHPGDPQGKLVPQLRETAAWLAGLDKGIFQHILTVDPETLLRTDVPSADVSEISALVSRLLECADNEEWIDRDWSVHRSYAKLKHRQLAAQLRPYICDKSRGLFARRVATDIAEACEVHELQNDLVEVTLDQSEDMSVRINAAYAVNRIADTETKAKLGPLAFGTAGDDPDDELKGRGLRALWPDHVKSEELLPLLTYPKRPSLYGSYKSFLDAFARELGDLDLVGALSWIREGHIYPDPGSPFRSLRNEILRRAWAQADRPEVRDALAEMVVDKVKKLRGDEKEKFPIEDEKRREVVAAAIQRLSQDPNPTWYSLAYDNRLVFPSDVPWLIEKITAEDSIQAQELLAEIISRMLDWRNTDHVAQIIESSKQCPVLATTFSLFLNPVYLDSEQAAAQRKAHANAQKVDSEESTPPPLEPPASERVQAALKRFDAGDTEAWWQLNLQLSMREDGFRDNETESDLTKLSGWEANPELRQRIIDGAKTYLGDGDPEAAKWERKNIMYRPAYAGYRAFRLLLGSCPDYLLALPAETWAKWACILFSYPYQTENSDADAQRRLVELAYERVPAEIIRALLVLIDKENKTDGFISWSTLENCWSDDISKALMQKLKQGRLKHNFFIQILSGLLEHDFDEAKRYAERLVRRKPLTPNAEKRRLTAARLLIAHAADAGWHVVWPRIRAERAFGRQVIESSVSSVSRRKTKIGEQLTEEELADLFIWLAHEYPYANDPRHEGMYSVSSDDEARRFRDSVLHQLKERGTPRAVSSIRRIIAKLPHLPWLKWTLIEAQETSHRRSWVPLQPSEIRRIAADQELRLVQSGEQLLNVVIESLKRLEKKLHGETPAAIDLWNELGSGIYRPKKENALSNYVKRHFDEDLKARGIIVGREVQIRQSEGLFKGQNTDIHVDAFTRDANGNVADRITVIVETKGCWNADLDHAMETQLKDRYLKNHASPFGLYLVGWFNCQQWSSDDRRKQRSARLTLPQARDKFEQQAVSLSDEKVSLRAFVLNAGLPSSSESGSNNPSRAYAKKAS